MRAYARVLSRHTTKYIPGKPNIVVQNMPGAGSVTAAQYLYVPAIKILPPTKNSLT